MFYIKELTLYLFYGLILGMKLVWTDKGKKYKGDKILMQISHSCDFELQNGK